MTMTYGQLEDALRAAIQASVADDDDTETKYVWVVDFTDTYVVYEIGWDSYMQDDYTLGDDGNPVLAGKPVPVKASTTYVPMGADSPGIERRGRDSGPPRRIRSESLAAVRVTSEPLTYRQNGPFSLFRDTIERGGGAEERLTRHRQEMDVVTAARAVADRRRLEQAGVEYRASPDTQAGLGGNFTVPLWLNDLFATAPRSGQVLAGQIKMVLPCPTGVSSINLPIITGKGTQASPAQTDAAVTDRDLTDAAGSSTVVTFAGNEDSALQLLEQSPPGAYYDEVVFTDLMDDYDQQLEAQLVSGLGSARKQLLGLANVATIIKVTYTATSPTGKGIFPYFGKVAAKMGDTRKRPPEAWLMRTARYAWLMSSEDSSTRVMLTPGPIEGVASILGWPTFLNDAMPATLGTGANQDQVIACRPSDLILFRGDPVCSVMREPLSGSLGVRIQMHVQTAAITNRYPSGIAVLQGTGLVVQTGF